MASDLLSIGASGVLAQQKMLSTTSNNIANVSTAGYIRQSTVLTANTNGLGVGDSTTRRLYDTYAQAQVWTDTSSYKKAQTSYDVLSQLDTYLSDTSTGLTNSIDSVFSALQSANSSPSNATYRQSMLTSLSSTTSAISTVSNQLSSLYETVNSNISSTVDDVNSMLTSLSDLNAQILKSPSADDDGTRANLLDQRDQLITSLSEKLDIKVLPQDNGTTQVNLISGEPLVLPGNANAATLSVVEGDPNAKNTSLQLKLGTVSLGLSNSALGGTIGGYFSARDTIETTQKQVGQLSLAFSDAMNTQNKLGMTLNNEIGSDVFSMSSINGLPYSGTSSTATVTASIAAGSGSNLTPNDFEVSYSALYGLSISLIDGDKKTQVYNDSISSGSGTVNLSEYGLNFDVSSMTDGDKFLIQPTLNAASSTQINNITQEDLALASPLKVSASSDNYGTATVALNSMSNTSAIDTTTTPPTIDANAPSRVVINDAGEYELYSASSSTPIATLTPSNTFNGANIIAAAYGSTGTTYPGFEFSISGTVKPGDEFNISFNTNGFSDNTNGLALANLSSKDLVRNGISSSTDNKKTINEAYNSTVASVGSTVSSLKTLSTAANAKLTQSQSVYESVAGVSLDEEAANLIRYQQAYAASAKVITAAKETFDTLLGAVG
jgi:flagellar hook-associated protein 1 FlgK